MLTSYLLNRKVELASRSHPSTPRYQRRSVRLYSCRNNEQERTFSCQIDSWTWLDNLLWCKKDVFIISGDVKNYVFIECNVIYFHMCNIYGTLLNCHHIWSTTIYVVLFICFLLFFSLLTGRACRRHYGFNPFGKYICGSMSNGRNCGFQGVWICCAKLWHLNCICEWCQFLGWICDVILGGDWNISVMFLFFRRHG